MIFLQAAGRHQCAYLIDVQSTEFLLQGGDERWLRGLDHAPQKLRDLYEINKLMAHRPWLISKTHIQVSTSVASAAHAPCLFCCVLGTLFYCEPWLVLTITIFTH